jgi:two-component system chemotaxis response regulator CheY
MAVAASGLSVALVDDEELVRNAIGRTLSFAGYRVIALDTGDALVEQYRAGLRADLVVLDMDMPGRDGHATLVALNELDPEVRAIMVSGHPYDGRAEETLRLGAVSYLQKPCDGRALTEAVDAALHAARRPRRSLEDTIGPSAKDTERPRRKP